MTYVRPEVYKAISENSLDDVLFTDPFTEPTRKSKRNLVVASFITLLIVTLELKISGFLGLRTEAAPLGPEITQGLACLVVSYLLIAFVFAAYIDYTAWQFKRERMYTKPYLDLISLFEQQVSVTGEQIANAAEPLRNHIEWSDPAMQYEIDTRQRVEHTLQQITEIEKRLETIANETKPLVQSWRETIIAMSRLKWRLRARFVGLWTLDIGFPLVVSGAAIFSTAPHLHHVVTKLSS